MATTLAPVLVQRFVDANGAALYLGQLSSFAAGTNIPLATYTDSTGSTQNTNPVILNPRGEANVWIPPNVAYLFQLSDAAGNLIWTVDNVVNSQLITLYGGVDTGFANAYVLNFTANFTSYTDGVIVYWIPANSNTGASTININGLGVINITNQDGSPLRAGQIVANNVVSIMIKGGAALLLSGSIANAVLAVPGTVVVPSIAFQADSQTGFYQASAGIWAWAQGSAQTGTLTTGITQFTVTGITGLSTINVPYTNYLNMTTLIFSQLSGTSSSTGFSLGYDSLTGSAAARILPQNTPGGLSQWVSIPAAQDNSASLYGQVAKLNVTGSPIAHSFTITFYKNGNATGWTASGTKGLGDTSGGAVAITYVNNGSL